MNKATTEIFNKYNQIQNLKTKQNEILYELQSKAQQLLSKDIPTYKPYRSERKLNLKINKFKENSLILELKEYDKLSDTTINGLKELLGFSNYNIKKVNHDLNLIFYDPKPETLGADKLEK